MMFIKNDKVALRIAEPHDADNIYRWENDMEVWRDSETRVPLSLFQIERFLLSNNDLESNKQLRLIIEDAYNGVSVGCIDIYDYDVEPTFELLFRSTIKIKAVLFCIVLAYSYLCTCKSNAIVAQLVELWLPKPKVAGSSPVYRSSTTKL